MATSPSLQAYLTRMNATFAENRLSLGRKRAFSIPFYQPISVLVHGYEMKREDLFGGAWIYLRYNLWGKASRLNIVHYPTIHEEGDLHNHRAIA